MVQTRNQTRSNSTCARNLLGNSFIESSPPPRMSSPNQNKQSPHTPPQNQTNLSEIVNTQPQPKFSDVVKTPLQNLAVGALGSTVVNNIQSTLTELKNLLEPSSADTDSYDCTACHKEVAEGTLGLTCDYCEKWVHFECSGLSMYEYDFFGNNPLPAETPLSVKFICKVCKQSDPYSKLSLQVEGVNKQNKVLQKSMVTLIDLLSGKDIVSADKIKAPVEETLVKSVEESVQTSIKEVLNDNKEKEDLKNNSIIFNAKEPVKEPGKSLDDCHKEDVDLVNKILRAANGDHAVHILDKNRVTRLGKKKDDQTRPRPIKVSFPSEDEKWHLVRNLKKVKENENFKHLSIQHDKTTKEKNDDRALQLKCIQKRKETGGQDYVIFAQQIMLRTEIDAFKQERARKRDEERNRKLESSY